MNVEFIKVKHQVLTYELKEGTKTSFYQTAGPLGILPSRITFSNYFHKEGLRKAKFEINGQYKISESGLYYGMNKRKVHTKIISIGNYPMFIGWGEIDARFGIYDLLIFHSENNAKQSFQIHHFRGLAKPEYLDSVCHYLQAYINKKSLSNDRLCSGY